MKEYLPKDRNEISLIAAGTKEQLKLPKDGFIESDGFENVLEKLGLSDKFYISPAKLKSHIGKDLNNKTLLIMRRGGYGDICWMTTIVRKFKSLFPLCKIWFASNPRHHMVYKNNKDVFSCIPYPIPRKQFDEADYHLSFEQCIEPIREPISVYKLIQERAHLELTSDECIPIYKPDEKVLFYTRKYLRERSIEPKDFKVMFHMASSAPYKSWPPQNSISAAMALADAGCKVFLAGNKKDFPFELPQTKNIFNVCNRKRLDTGELDDYWSMEHSIGLLSRMDLLIGQDSAFTHFAAALNIPNIVIMGPFPAAAYLSTYPKAIAVEPQQGACSLMPCYPHTDNPCPSVNRFGYSPCLSAVSSDVILDIIQERWGIVVANRIDVEIRGCR